MLLMGDHNWYMPKWLDKIVPHISIEGAEFFSEHDKPMAPDPEPDPTEAAV